MPLYLDKEFIYEKFIKKKKNNNNKKDAKSKILADDFGEFGIGVCVGQEDPRAQDYKFIVR